MNVFCNSARADGTLINISRSSKTNPKNLYRLGSEECKKMRSYPLTAGCKNQLYWSVEKYNTVSLKENYFSKFSTFFYYLQFL